MLMKKNLQICWVSNMQTFTVRIYSTIVFSLLSQLALAQLRDDFSDGDFTSSPTWTGSQSLFSVTNATLMLNGGERDGVAYLSSPSEVSNPASWDFDFSFLFNPSSANYAKVYLISDQADLTKSLNGYFVMLGRTSDAISLYRQNDLKQTEIIKGRDNLLNLSSIHGKVKVTRDDSGWKLFTDVTESGSYNLEGMSQEDTSMQSSYFGVVCVYTSTRADKFSFDNFNVTGSVAVDNVPPSLTRVEVVSSLEIRLVFSEPLDQQSATAVGHYLIDESIHPTEAILEDDRRTVLLVFSDALPQQSHTIAVSGVSDLNANNIDTFQMEFEYIAFAVADVDDVIVNEIYADPSPNIGLGDSEFVEIYNRSDRTFDLSDWTISDGSSSATLPTYVLKPKSYAVLAPENSSEAFQNTVFLKGFPSLNNADDVLLLKDKTGALIDSVNYDQSWYRNTDKENGGWTLELIDPENLCSEHENWAASEDVQGGTPGYVNSIHASKPDLIGPRLLSAVAVDSITLRLRFNEKLEKPLPIDLHIETSPSLDIHGVRFSNPALTEIDVSILKEIQKGTSYSVSVSNLHDCIGNLVEDDSKATFGLPEQADSLDVRINEILFNPRPTGVDFVEILNTSPKFINLRGWSIGNPDNDKISILTMSDVILEPGQYMAITTNTTALESEYIQEQKGNLFQMKDLPSFNDDSGSVLLMDDQGNEIDFFRYSKEMHSIFLKDDEGVSLERISASDANLPQNWASASASVGFATPGLINSNLVGFDAREEPVRVQPEIFSPLMGQPNFALIHYNFEQGGYVANIKIFDSHGRSVRQLANNDILGTTGFYRWDGARDDGSKASIGSYMVWFEVFNSEGTVKRYRHRIAIAAAF